MRKPGFLDWIVYRLFLWRWNPIFQDNPEMLQAFIQYMQQWRKDHRL